MSARRPRTLVTHWIHDDVADELRRFADPVLNETRETLPAAEILARCRDAEALVAFMPDTVDDEFLSRCPRLRIVSAALKGFDNFDVAACTRRGVWLTIVPDLLTIPTAELALGLLLAVTRHILPGDQHVRSGRFSGWKPRWYGAGLTGATAGILGFGRVGQALASRLSAFGTRVVYADSRRLSDAEEGALGVTHRAIEPLLAESDFVFPFLPLSPETRHLLGASALGRMKRGSYLVNCGRGSLVDEAEVAAALRSGQLAGYAADVFEMEDWARADRPREVTPALLDPMLNTVFTPHLGSAVDGIRRDIAREAVLRIEEWARGERPRYAVNAPAQATTG
jgi:phosphonate dehydrogenase